MRIIILCSLLVFWSCHGGQKNKSDFLTSDSSTLSDTIIAEQHELTEPDTSNLILEKVTNINDSSKILLRSIALSDFEMNGKSRSTTINDSLFIEFLKSFTTYQNEANDILFDDPNYEIYNTLAYSEDDVIDPKALEFQDSVKQIGFIVEMTEGMIFLEKDPEFLDRFSPYLSLRMNIFRNQYNLENEQPLAEDGGLIISTEEQINRMIFWEDFATNYPDFELPEYANNHFEMYLFYLMFGMDNTPIHDWSDSMKVQPEMIDTYKSVIIEHPNSRAVDYLSDYLEYIQLKNFKYDRSFNDYGRQKFPQFYDETN